MLTFLPMIGFFKSLRTLDDARLGKQRQDAFNLLKTLLGGTSDLPNDNPALWSVRMWQGHEYALGVYGMSACNVWSERGNKDRLAFEIHELLDGFPHDLVSPPWMGDLNVHRSHRSYLIRRKPQHYAHQWPNTPESMPIIWPQILEADPDSYRLRISRNEQKLLEQGERQLPEWLRFDQHRNEIIDLDDE
jgi:hypothetical protein